MMVRVGVGIVVGLLTAGSISAELEGLDELLAAHHAALGGADRLQSVDSARFLGVMSIGVEAEAPFVLTFKRPLRSRLEFTVEGLTGIQAFDGTTAWMILPMIGQSAPEVMPEGQAVAMAEQADFDGPLVDWKSKGHQLVLLGTEELESGRAYKIEVTLANGTVRNYFLDAWWFPVFPGLAIAFVTLGTTVGQPYKAVDTLKLPEPVGEVLDVPSPHEHLKILRSTSGRTISSNFARGMSRISVATRCVLTTRSPRSPSIDRLPQLVPPTMPG